MGVFLAWRFAGLRANLVRLAAPALLGCALFLPWTFYAFTHQLETGDPPTSAYRGLLVWLEAYAHFLFLNARLGGDAVFYAVALPGVALGAFLGVLGAVDLARELRAGKSPAFPALLLALGIVAPTWAYLASLVHARSGFHLKYLASFAAPLVLIVAAGASGAAWRRALGILLFAAMLAVTAVNVASRGRQDVLGAVDFILEHAQPGDAVLARAWWFRDPERSPTDFGWYADRRADGRARPAQIPVLRTAEALAHPRVWVIHTGGYPRWALENLSRNFAQLETFPFGPEATLHLYSAPRTEPAPPATDARH